MIVSLQDTSPIYEKTLGTSKTLGLQELFTKHCLVLLFQELPRPREQCRNNLELFTKKTTLTKFLNVLASMIVVIDMFH